MLVVGGVTVALIITIWISNTFFQNSEETMSSKKLKNKQDSSEPVYGSDVYRNSYNQKIYEKKYREKNQGWGESYDRIIKNKQKIKKLNKINPQAKNNK